MVPPILCTARRSASSWTAQHCIHSIVFAAGLWALMGFPITHVVTNDTLVSEFICKICFQLVEHPSYTQCTHVFCASCFNDWYMQTPRCPTCNKDLGMREVGELKHANPLAWRLLSRVQCKCPVENCGWQGDYSELSSHLTNSESHTKASVAAASKASVL